MTGENWYDIMFALSKQRDEDFYCVNDPSIINKSNEAIACGDPY